MHAKALLVFLVAMALLPSSAQAVTVSRAELSSGQLRVEGTAAASAPVTVTSDTSTASGSSSSSGSFRIEASSFRSSNCRVTVSDGGRTAAAEATLSGCTPASTTTPPPSTSTCTIQPQAPTTMNVGTLTTQYFLTTGCRTSEKPVQWKVVTGAIPPGMTLFTQGVSSGGITGRPTTEGIYRFTLEVKDQTGATDREAFQVTVEPPRPLVITNQSDALSPGVVGELYCCGNLFADGGVPGYTWSLRAGALPPGLQLTASPGRITGTPTTAGTFVFTVRVTDTRGAFAERTFSITIS